MFHDYYRKRRDLFHNPPWLNGFHSRALCIISQYLRDIILGLNDGLVSTFLLVFGMYGGGALARSILLAGIMGALAGSISMAIGEFVATKSQLQIVSSDIMSERYV